MSQSSLYVTIVSCLKLNLRGLNALQHAVRISDLGQGLNPMRITSIRSLPDLDTDDALRDADDEVKKHLKRDHVVSPQQSYMLLPPG